MTMSTPNLLGIPLEIRELIYEELLLLPRSSPKITINILPHQNIPNNPAGENQCTPLYNLLLTCHQLQHEISTFTTRQTIQISTTHASKNLYTKSNIPCLCGFSSCFFFKFFQPKLSIRIDPFQQRETIPAVYTALLALTRRLSKIPSLPDVKISLDGILPRTSTRRHGPNNGMNMTRNPPLSLNELDLQRAPLHMIVLLFPFRLLKGVKSSKVSIKGGPRNDPWSSEKYIFLREFSDRVREDMQTQLEPEPNVEKTPVGAASNTSYSYSNCLVIDLITALEFALKDDGIIWEDKRLADLVGLGVYPQRERSIRRSSWSSDRELERLDDICGVCGNLFYSARELRRHGLIFHNAVHVVTDGEDMPINWGEEDSGEEGAYHIVPGAPCSIR